MLKVVVVEKGGPERELFFAADEVSIGRIQNNGIVLPKPNVSKRHAVIQVSGGRVQINDLKSTNGTYVNGRRIVQPKELVDDDRVYIGDYVLRANVVEPDTVGHSDVQPVPTHDQQRASTIAMPAFDIDMPPPPPPEDSMEMPPLPPPPPLPAEVAAQEFFDSRVSAASGVSTSEVEPDDAGLERSEVAAPPEFEFEVEVDEPAEFVEQPETAVVFEPAPAPAVPAFTEVVSAPVAQPAWDDSASSASGIARRLGFDKLYDPHESLRALAEAAGASVFAGVDPSRDDFSDDEWQKLSDSVMRLVDRLRRENRISRDADPIALTQQVMFEFAGLGPLEELLTTPSIKAIAVNGVDSIHVVAEGRTRRHESVFASEATLERVIVKLRNLAGITGEGPLVEGRLPDGSMLQIMGRPLVETGRVVVIERPVARVLSVDELVDNARITEEAASVIRSAVAGRRNIVVCGAPSSGRSVFVNALVTMIDRDCRVLVLGGRRELNLDLANMICMNKAAVAASPVGGASIVNRVFPDYVVINGIECADTRLVQELGLAGRDGMIMTMTAMSAEDCISRMKLMLQFAGPGIDGAAVDALVDRIADIIVVLKVDAGGSTVVSGVFETITPDSLKVSSSLSLIGMGVLAVDGE